MSGLGSRPAPGITADLPDFATVPKKQKRVSGFWETFSGRGPPRQRLPRNHGDLTNTCDLTNACLPSRKAKDGKADDGKADEGKAGDGKADDGKAVDGKADHGDEFDEAMPGQRATGR